MAAGKKKETYVPLPSLTRVTKSYLLALGTTQISSFFTKHWTKFLNHQTGNYPVTCFVSKPSRITLVELSIVNTSYQKLPFGVSSPICFSKTAAVFFFFFGPRGLAAAHRTRVTRNIPDLPTKAGVFKCRLSRDSQPVSYTHLTLPTIYSV